MDAWEGRPRPELERLMIDAVRVLAMDAVQQARSGHPGTPMALAPLGYLAFTRHLAHSPANPDWPDRDRFVLSCGHASMLLYALLHLSGYDLSLDDIRDFRQWGSRTPGHPEVGHTPGVETTTGPLGQGVAMSVGMAMAERWLAARFNRPGHEVVDHHTYAVCSDGDLMEGVSHEAAALAGHQRLGKLIWIWDDNGITIDGSTELSTSTDTCARFAAYGWHVQRVDSGEDLEQLDKAIVKARRTPDQPSFIALRTVIGFGSPNLAGSEKTHGSPLGPEEIAATKENLGYPSQEPFHVVPEAAARWSETAVRGARLEQEWQERFARYQEAFPALAADLETAWRGGMASDWAARMPSLTTLEKAEATRASSGRVLQELTAIVPELIGGSADLTGSNKTDWKDAPFLTAAQPDGRYVHYGIREHGMGAVMNGMALHGGVRPYGGTFLVFSDYARPAIRLAALMGVNPIWVFTHDSIGLGEDGPTHQPVEHVMTLRAIPGVLDLRPCDGPEVAAAWKAALRYRDGPSFLSLTRQSVPVLDREDLSAAEGLARGAYVLREASGSAPPDAIVLASGSEVAIALEAAEGLEADGVRTRVVSMPSWRLFEAQSREYRDEVLPPTVTNRVSIEAGTTLGWSRWLGPGGRAVGLDRFGASAPHGTLYRELGISADAVMGAALAFREREAAGAV